MTANDLLERDDELRQSHELQQSHELRQRMASASAAYDFLKALANEQRLLILCLLADGEKSVTALVTTLQLRQSAVSQQLARLRGEGLVTTRRDGKMILYSLSPGKATTEVLNLLHKLFCAKEKDA